MAIRQSKYIDITSGVGGRSAVSDRELIARVFTTNELCGFGHVYEFNDADSVMEYFGSSSNEYKYAVKYFGFVSKNVSKAKKISFIRWSSTAANPYIASTAQVDTTIANYTTNSNSKLALCLGENIIEITLDLAGAADLSALATKIAASISAYTDESDATPFAGTTCVISSGRVTITLPSTITDTVYGCAVCDIPSGKQYDVATLLNITASASPVLSNYTAGETPAEAAARSDALSDNYGSFFFLSGVSKAQARAVAEWNQSKNYKYLYLVGRQGYTNAVGSLVGDVKEWGAKDTGLAGFVGTALWAYKSADDCIESLPAALFATTDYSRANSTKTFMYQQNDTIQAAITNDSCANELDALNINYMGVTQSAGALIQFSQDGNNMDGVETSVYCNEVWMKAKFWTAIMNLFLAVEKVPANDDGKGMIKTVMMDTITTAIRNGTIQPMKTLNVTQKVYIGQVLNDTDAWKSVYTDGYVLDIVVEQDGNRYIAKYILVYSKGDAIRKVEGSDILI